MDMLFRRYQWVLRLAAITVAMTMIAIIVNHVAASQLAPLTVPKLPTYKTQAADSQSQRGGGGDETPGMATDKWDEKLTDRCFFGCIDTGPEPKRCPEGCGEDEECQDGVCVPVKEEKPKGPQADVPVESDLGVKLLGCMVADNADYSLAMMQDEGSQETYVVSPGDYLPEDAKVVEIKRDRIFIRRDGQLEFIRLKETIGGDPSPTAVRNRPFSNGSNSRRLEAGGSADGGGSGSRSGGSTGKSSSVLRESSGNEYVLEGETLEKRLEDMENVAGSARIISNFENGERNGLKMVGVSPSGLYAELGFQTGDVLQSINGEKLRNQGDAQRMLEHLREKKSVELVVERDGQEVRREYHVE